MTSTGKVLLVALGAGLLGAVAGVLMNGPGPLLRSELGQQAGQQEMTATGEVVTAEDVSTFTTSMDENSAPACIWPPGPAMTRVSVPSPPLMVSKVLMVAVSPSSSTRPRNVSSFGVPVKVSTSVVSV